MDPAKRIEDLVAWQLASRLRDLVYEMTESGRVLKDERFWKQIRDSSASVPRNLAEGFGRYYPTENAYYTRIAKASLIETQNHLLHGLAVRYWSRPVFTAPWRISCRAMKAVVPYLLYLESCGGKIPEKAPPLEPKEEPPTDADAAGADDPDPEPGASD